MAQNDEPKITYSTSAANLDAFHSRFDSALERVVEEIGTDIPHFIDNRPVQGRGDVYASVNPADTRQVLGRFRNATEDEIRAAVDAARRAQPGWAATNYKERAATIQRAAALIRERKYELSALTALEVGKNRMESIGDVEEAADLMDYYAQQLVDAGGFHRPLAKLAPNEETLSVLRPYGVWAVIAPFNFPLSLSAGMSAGALLGGNTVVYKPSDDTPVLGWWLTEILRDAGFPPGVFNFIAGQRHVGKALAGRPDLDGIVFTGSKAVGLQLHREFSKNFVKPVITEMGGKNPAIVMPSADLDVAAEGVMRSAFGLQGQKCSACSRVYVHRDVHKAFVEALVEKSKSITIGDPTRRDVFMGPLINKRAFEKYPAAVYEAQQGGGEILLGGKPLTDGDYAHGFFVEQTIVDGLPATHRLFRDELFLPFVTLCAVDSLEEAIRLSNDVEYGLTAGIFSEDENELQYFFDHIQAGVTYANRRAGATTGAWPGVNSFCGWKGSGSTGKGACGPYYVMQFMREQSRTIIR